MSVKRNSPRHVPPLGAAARKAELPFSKLHKDDLLSAIYDPLYKSLVQRDYAVAIGCEATLLAMSKGLPTPVGRRRTRTCYTHDGGFYQSRDHHQFKSSVLHLIADCSALADPARPRPLQAQFAPISL
jgi:hypothetical protein